MTAKTAAVVPFYNEASTIGKILNELLIYVDFVIAVNDGSDDNWQNEIPQDERIILLQHSGNLGKGAALRTGFQKAMELNVWKVITIDADYQHEPSFIPKFLKKLDDCQIVVGNRLENISSMPFPRKLSNLITSFLLSLKTGVKIKDSQCGFRGFRSETIEHVITNENGFEAESLMLIKAARNNFSICFVKIPTIYGDDNSKMKNIRAIFGFIKILFK
jgi:glycosyltransferase involved in cell wall biosynthesis